ncbi:hypothetical protein CLU79DRAFT_770273 [Phycomyces nitens]|nr:hypothetical protein CLU79DRAFT_770273 [Phycomyces nitens]
MARLSYILTASSLLLAQVVAAQHSHGTQDPPMPAFNSTGTEPMSYALFPEYKGYFYLHVFFMVLAFWVFLPIGIMFGIARSSLHLPTQILCFITAMFGFFFAKLYGHTTPHLYSGNSHHSMGWSLFLLLIVQMSVGVLRKVANAVGRMNTASYNQLENVRLVRSSSSSSSSSSRPDRHSVASSADTLHHNEDHGYRPTKGEDDEDDDNNSLEDPLDSIDIEPQTKSHWYHRLDFTNRVPSSVKRVCKILAHNPLTTTCFRHLHQILGRVFPVLIFVQTLSGLVVYHGVCRSWSVLGCIAHLIKGGIFFFYGIVTFGRYLGAFANRGWAWNRVDNGSKFSFEMIECCLIFTYGITNTWMEHFGQNSAWTHKDLEHASLAFMWWWCGLVGILVESRTLRRLLNRTEGTPLSEPKHEQTQTFSMNPFPALTVLMTGISMGNHHQDTAYSTQVHYMWGLLLSMAAVFRFVTYATMYTSPPTNSTPSRPPSEAVGAFLLIAGSILFMASNSGTMTWLRRNEVDSMFMMNGCVALSSMTLGYVAFLMIIKAWAKKREERKKTPNVHGVDLNGAAYYMNEA